MSQDTFPRNTIEQKATTPPTEFFLPDDIKQQQADADFREATSHIGREDAVIITHDDADGLTSGAFMRDWFESVAEQSSAVVIPTGYRSPCNLPRAVEIINADPELQPGWLFITDLGASLFNDCAAEIEALFPETNVVWIDHHQWTDDEYERLRQCAHAFIDSSTCATQLVVDLRNGADEFGFPLEPDGAPSEQEELARVVEDHDLWVKDDPRSDRVAVFAEYADNTEFIDAALDGITLLDTYDEVLSTYEAEDTALRNRLVDLHSSDQIAGLDIAFSYGYGPTAAAGNELVEQLGFDVAVIIRPDGGVSFYAHSNEDGFVHCHDVADAFDGGGHPTAAGGEIDITTFADYCRLWQHQDTALRGRFRSAFKTVQEHIE